MPRLLIYAEQPQQARDWERFCALSNALPVSEHAQRLAPHVWLLTVPEADSWLVKLREIQRRTGLSCWSLEADHQGKWQLGL
jgi:hypothetical protein